MSLTREEIEFGEKFILKYGIWVKQISDFSQTLNGVLMPIENLLNNPSLSEKRKTLKEYLQTEGYDIAEIKDNIETLRGIRDYVEANKLPLIEIEV